MKVMATWRLKPGALREAVGRFLKGDANPGAGVTLLGRWHAVDVSMGFSLYETNDATLLHFHAGQWAELLDIEMKLVIEDDQAGPNLATVFKA